MSPFRRLRWSRQGIRTQNLGTAKKGAFFLTLRRLAERHELLPDRMVIKEGINVVAEVVSERGYGEVRSGTYKGHRVAVKTMKVPVPRNPKEKQDVLRNVRKVSINVDSTGRPFTGRHYLTTTS